MAEDEYDYIKQNPDIKEQARYLNHLQETVDELASKDVSTITITDTRTAKERSEFNPSSSGTISTAVSSNLLDEDDMASDSDAQGATQQSIKAYVDSQDHDHATPIATHTSDVDAHHAKYTNAEAIAAVEGETTLDVLHSDLVTVNANDHHAKTVSGDIDHGSVTGLGDDDHTQYLLADGTRALSGNLSAGSNKLTTLATPTAGGDAATKDYVDSLVQGLDWQESVLDRYDPSGGLPASPSTGDRYLSTATANGWTVDYIYEYDGSSWIETVPDEGFSMWVEDEDVQYRYDGTSWNSLGSVSDHGGLTGLADDDHTQYHTDARALTWLQSQSVTQLSDVSGAGSGSIITSSERSGLHTSHSYYTDTDLEDHLSGGTLGVDINLNGNALEADGSTINGNIGFNTTDVEAWSTILGIEGANSALGFHETASAIYMYSNAWYDGTNNVYKSASEAGRFTVNEDSMIYQYAVAGANPDDTISWIRGMDLDGGAGTLDIGTASNNIETTIHGEIIAGQRTNASGYVIEIQATSTAVDNALFRGFSENGTETFTVTGTNTRADVKLISGSQIGTFSNLDIITINDSSVQLTENLDLNGKDLDNVNSIDVAGTEVLTSGRSLTNIDEIYAQCNASTSDGQNISANATSKRFIRNTSSIKYKQNIRSISDIYDMSKFEQLRPSVWDENPDKIDDPQSNVSGFVADYIDMVYPHMVFYDENEEPIGYSRQEMQALIVAKTQEIVDKMQELEKRIIQLEGGETT